MWTVRCASTDPRLEQEPHALEKRSRKYASELQGCKAITTLIFFVNKTQIQNFV